MSDPKGTKYSYECTDSDVDDDVADDSDNRAFTGSSNSGGCESGGGEAGGATVESGLTESSTISPAGATAVTNTTTSTIPTTSAFQQQQQRLGITSSGIPSGIPILLPNGEIINAKNTLQSFDYVVAPRRPPPNHHHYGNKNVVTVTATAAHTGNEVGVSAVASNPFHQQLNHDVVRAVAVVTESSVISAHVVAMEPSISLQPPLLVQQQQQQHQILWCKTRKHLIACIIVVVIAVVSVTAVVCGASGNCSKSSSPFGGPMVAPSPSLLNTSVPVSQSTAPIAAIISSQPSGKPMLQQQVPSEVIIPTATAASPTSSPTASPTSSPITSPTSKPTASPLSSSPLPPPQSLSKVEVMTTYVNNITLSGRNNINMNGTNSEDAALRWMIMSDPIFSTINTWTSLSVFDTTMSTNISTVTEDKFRFQQRYALLTLWYQQQHQMGTTPGTDGTFQTTWVNENGWISDIDECNWYGIICASNSGATGTASSQYVVTDINFYNDTSYNGNGVTGPIPADLGLLIHLQRVTFRKNDLLGTLPSSIGRWTALAHFDVHENILNGTLPSTIGLWTALTHFDVHDNALSGTLPPTIGQMTALTNFDVSINEMMGTLPSTIGSWSLIESAFFNDNQFTGSMPSGICIFRPNLLWVDCVINCPSCCTQCD